MTNRQKLCALKCDGDACAGCFGWACKVCPIKRACWYCKKNKQGCEKAATRALKKLKNKKPRVTIKQKIERFMNRYDSRTRYFMRKDMRKAWMNGVKS